MKKIKRKLREIIDWLIPTETLGESKAKWNAFGKKNARYFVYTDKGEKIIEEDFRNSGRIDYQKYVAGDPLPPRGKNKTALEVGCGIGRITEFFCNDFGRVFGIDISSEMISQAKKRLSKKDDLVFKETDGKSYPFSDNFFDFIFSFTVFQHMPSKEIIRNNMEEIARTLKPGGIAKIQLRGAPARKTSPYYGPHFNLKNANDLINGLPLKIIKTDGEGSRYFWLWLEKIIKVL